MGRQYADPIFEHEKIRRRRRGPVVVLLLLVILVTAAALVNGFINRQVQLIRQSVTIPSLSSSLEGFKILHISDLHGAGFGHGQAGIEATLRNVRYNAVVISGDSLSADGNDAQLMQLITLLDKSVPVFLVAGDEDPPPILSTPHGSASPKADYIQRAESFGAIYLDAPYELQVGNSILWLCPDTVYDTDVDNARLSMENSRRQLLNDPDSEAKSAALRALDYWLERIDRTEEALRKMKSGDFKICVTHVPYSQERLAELRYNDTDGLRNNAKPVSLILAGHLNNGQFRLPLIGPVFVPRALGVYGEDRWFPGDGGLSGLSTLYGISQYISPGLGASSAYSPLSIRFMNPPAVTLITLTSKLVY